MTRHNTASSERDDSAWSLLTGLLVGGLLGAAFGMLYAPKSGSSMREDLGGACKRLPKRLSDEWSSSQGKAKHLIDKTKVNLESKVEKVSDALQARKMAKAKRLEDMASGGYDLN